MAHEIFFTDEEEIALADWQRKFNQMYNETQRLCGDLRIRDRIKKQVTEELGELGFVVELSWENYPKGQRPVVTIVDRVHPIELTDSDKTAIAQDSDTDYLLAHGVSSNML